MTRTQQCVLGWSVRVSVIQTQNCCVLDRSIEMLQHKRSDVCWTSQLGNGDADAEMRARSAKIVNIRSIRNCSFGDSFHI